VSVHPAAEALERFIKFTEETPRKRSTIEAPYELTRPVVHLTAAWAFGRIGEPTPAPWALFELRSRGEVERFVGELFDARLAQREPALAEPKEAFSSYQVARLLQASQVLSPWEAPDPIAQFTIVAIKGPSTAPLEPRRSLSMTLAELDAVTLQGRDYASTAQAVLRAAAIAGLDPVLQLLPSIERRWPTVTDSYNTNAHWCLSVIGVVDAVAFALAQAVNPLQRPTA
jgi:hypothetical protein